MLSIRHKGRPIPWTHGVLVLVQFIFATFPVAGKMAFMGFDPLAIAAWRVLAGALFLLFLARILYPQSWFPGRDLPWLVLLALFGVACNQVLFIEGLKRSTAVTASFMMGVIPVTTYGLALLFRQERYTLARGTGLLLALLGASLLVAAHPVGEGSGEASLLGNLMLLGNCLSYSLYLVLAKPLLNRHPSLVVTAWTFVLALPLVLPFAASVSWVSRASTWGPVLALAWILLLPTMLNYFLIAWALGKLPASVIGAYIYLQPVIGALLAVLVLGEKTALSQVAGGGFVLIGLYLVSKKQVKLRLGRAAKSAQASHKDPVEVKGDPY